MEDTSYIMTFRAGGERRANLQAVLAWLERHPPGEIILVEQDVAPTLGDLARGSALRLVFAYNPGPFNKAWGFNVGARFSRRPLLAFGDSDLIAPALGEALAACRRGVPVARTFDRVSDLGPAESARLRADPAALATIGDVGDARTTKGEVPPLCGGLVLFHRACYALLGGWDERFLGWGGEDDAMSVKVARAGLHSMVQPGPAFHLHHARATPVEGCPHYRSNLAVLAQLRTMPDAALKRLCDVSWQLAGHQDRHRPAEDFG